MSNFSLLNHPTIKSQRGEYWDFRFCGFGYLRDRFFGFCVNKSSVLRFCFLLRFANFSVFSIWSSVFVKNTIGLSDLVSYVVFGFSFLGSAVPLPSERQFSPPRNEKHSRETSFCSICHLIYQFWRFCMRFFVLIESFYGFGWFFSLGFAVSNRPQSSPR